MSDPGLERLVRLTRAAILALAVLHALPDRADAIKLSGPLVDGSRVLTSAISPDGSRVVYEADQDTKNVIELYSVPIGGGPATKLNPRWRAVAAISIWARLWGATR